MLDAGRHPNIEILTNSEIVGLTGEAGNFRATIKRYPRYVSEGLCTGCGLCARYCSEQAISGEKGKLYVIDQDKCVSCGVCKNVCKFDAVEIR